MLLIIPFHIKDISSMIPILQTTNKMELWFVSYGFSKFEVKYKKMQNMHGRLY